MHALTKTAGLLFLAASSVYLDGVAQGGPRIQAIPAGPATDAPDAALPAVEADGPAVAAEAAAAEPSDPFAVAEPAPQPVPTGKSVTSNDVSVNDAGTVEIHVNDASLVEVLRMLSLQSQRNIIASKEVRGTITANLYDVTVREALDAILHANGYAYREKGNFIYVYTVQELAEIEKAERRTSTEVFRLYYTPAANAVTMIKPVMSSVGQVAFTTAAASGVEESTGDAGGNSHATEDVLVVTDYADNLDAVRRILKEIDQRPQQVLIEATILRATLTDDNALGVDLNVAGGIDFNTVNISNGQITGGNLGGDGAFDSYATAGGTGNSFSNSVGGGLKVGFINNDIAVFIAALESITDTTVLANPKVLALNKQKGEVLVGREDGYLTTTVTESSAVQTVEFLKTGTRLIFRPYIGNDGFIRMEIHPEDSSGGLSDANLPFKITTEVTSNVMVKDGQTIVIGGLFREESTTSKGQIPFLGNLPLAGPLFRRQRDRTVREEVIILLTPHIVKDQNAYAQLSEEALRDMEKLRVGVRKGMMPWGRERLAEGEYERALEELNKPNPDRKAALWHLDAATNLNPKFVEAIKLKEQITGREITTVDNSTTRSFVTRAILAEKAAMPTTAPVVPAEDAAAPELQPAVEPVHTAEAPAVEMPTTQPVAEIATTQPVAEAPTTQPVQPDDLALIQEMSQRFTRAVAKDATEAAEAEDVAEADEAAETPVVAETPAEAPVAAEAPVTVEVLELEDDVPAIPTTITELPVDEISIGGNK